MIKNLKNKMYKYIDKYGLNSKKTIAISEQLDNEINKFYENSSMVYFYNQSKNGLLQYYDTHKNIPTISEWSKYAKENDYLSYESIQYMSGMRFDVWCLGVHYSAYKTLLKK